MTMTLNDVTKGALDAAAKVVRLPLQAAGAVVKPDDAATWAPALVLDQAEAGVRGFLGALLHDDALTTQADLQRARLSQLKRATQAQARADRTERLAAEQLHDRERDIQAEREQVRAKASKAKQVVKEEKLRADRRAAETAAVKKAAVARTTAAQEEGIQAREAEAERRRLDAEAVALEKQRTAVQAKGKALRLEDAVETVKESRSS